MGRGWGGVTVDVERASGITPTLPSPIKGEGSYCVGGGGVYGLNAPPGTAEATGLSKPFALTDDTPNTQSSTRM